MSGEEDAWWTKAAPRPSVPAQPDSPPPPATAGPTTTTYRARPRRRAPFGDQRGLTALGATILVLVLGSLGAAFDVNTGTGLRQTFTLVFCVAAGLAASTVHREDLLASVLLVPFVYTIICIFAAPMDDGGGSAKIVIGDMMLQSAPALIYAVLSAGVVALARWVLGRRRRTQRRIVSYR